VIYFFAPGIPRPKGSKKLVRTRAGRTLMLEASTGERAWAAAVRRAAMAKMAGHELFDGPVYIVVAFYFAHPKSHFTAKGKLRDDAPRWRIARPDTDKLVRSLGDALSGAVWKDDALVVNLRAFKCYGASDGTVVVVGALNGLQKGYP